jgi:hypothetical protein
MERVPIWFSIVLKLLLMVEGHGMDQTVGGKEAVRLNHTPPKPHLDASQHPQVVGS